MFTYGYTALALAGVRADAAMHGQGGESVVMASTGRSAHVWPPRVDVQQGRLKRAIGLATRGVQSISRKSPRVWQGRQLARFDSDNAMQSWRGVGARIQRSQHLSAAGAYSGRIVFEGGRRTPHMSLELGALDHQEQWDWADYHGLVMHVRKETPGAGSLFVQVEDVHGGRVRQVVSVSDEQPQRVSLDIDRMRESVDLRHIARVRFYQWMPEDSSAWYIDDISLVQTDDRF